MASISIILDPTKSSIVSPPVTQTLTVIDTQTVKNIVASATSLVLVTDAITPDLLSITNTPLPSSTNTLLPSTTSQQSTTSSTAQSTRSQSLEVNQASAAGAAPAKSGARKFDIDFVMPVVTAIGALALLVLRH